MDAILGNNYCCKLKKKIHLEVNLLNLVLLLGLEEEYDCYDNNNNTIVQLKNLLIFKKRMKTNCLTQL